MTKLRYYLEIYLKVLRKATKNLSQNSRYTAEIRTYYLMNESDICSPAVTYVCNQTGSTFTCLEIQFNAYLVNSILHLSTPPL